MYDARNAQTILVQSQGLMRIDASCGRPRSRAQLHQPIDIKSSCKHLPCLFEYCGSDVVIKSVLNAHNRVLAVAHKKSLPITLNTPILLAYLSPCYQILIHRVYCDINMFSHQRLNCREKVNAGQLQLLFLGSYGS